MTDQPQNPTQIDLSVPEPEHTLESALQRIDFLRAAIEANDERGMRLATYFLNEELVSGTPHEVIKMTSSMLRDHVAESGFAPADGDFWIYMTRDSYGIDAGDVVGRSDRRAIELATVPVEAQFCAPTVEGDNARVMMVPYAMVGEQTDVYGWLGIELLEGAEPDDVTISIVLAIAMWMRQQLERAFTVAEARHSTEVARIAAQIQLVMSKPLELDDALRQVTELMHESEHAVGAAAVRCFQDGTIKTLMHWGDLDSARAKALATGEEVDLRRTTVLPVHVDGVKEAAIVVLNSNAVTGPSDEMLATVAGAIGGSVARYRAAETIELLRRSATRQLIEAQERERSMIAADVHDGVLQQLGATAIRLELAQAQVDRGDFATARAIIGDGAKEIRSCARELRSLLMELRPQVLDDNGLAAALKELGHHLEEVEVEVATNVPDDLGNEYSITIFRIVQEALTNIQKHSQASHARVDVHLDDGSVEIEITDDGVGFEAAVTGPSAEGSHLGLLGMRERADMLGGTFSIEGRSGSGTRLVAVLPLKDGHENENGSTAE